MVIRETQKRIAQRKTDIAAYQKKVQGFPTKVTVPQRYLRGNVRGPTGILSPLMKREAIRKQYGSRAALKRKEITKVRKFTGDLQAYEKKFKKYLYSPEGRYQYAKEFGLKGEPVYAGRIITKDDKKVIERRQTGLKYKTPYGEVTDFGIEVGRQRNLLREWKQEQARLRKELGLEKGKVVIPFTTVPKPGPGKQYVSVGGGYFELRDI